MNATLKSLVAIGLASIAAASIAADPAPTADLRQQAMALMQQCKADVQKLCGSVEAGGGRKLACLDSHEADVTPECRDALPKFGAMQAAAKHGATPSAR